MSVDNSSYLVIGFLFTNGEVRERSRALFPDFEHHDDCTESLEKFAEEAGCEQTLAYLDCYNGCGFEDYDCVYLTVANTAKAAFEGNEEDNTIDLDRIDSLRAPLETLRLKLIDMGLSPGKAHVAVTTSIC